MTRVGGQLRQLIVYPDAELLVVEHLRARIAARVDDWAQGVKVGTRTPAASGPGRYLLVRRIGGTEAMLVVDAARLDVMVWHDAGDWPRGQLAQYARGVLLALPGRTLAGVAVYRVEEFTGPVTMPDPVDDTRLVTLFSVEIRLRGAAA